jgi:hypothetical protein
MRVLLDEQLPRHLAREIGGHDVSTVQQQGWAGLKNGELLRVAADAGFEVLVTLTAIYSFSKISPDHDLELSCSLHPATLLRTFFHLCRRCLQLFPRPAPASCVASRVHLTD